MASRTLKVTAIGNSRGVRLPAESLKRFNIRNQVIMEERRDGILLRPADLPGNLLSWEETAVLMALETEDWSVWDATLADGIDSVPWDHGARVRSAAETPPPKRTARARRHRAHK
jgi:hypothetical protein